MTTEAKALALVNAIQAERNNKFSYASLGRAGNSITEALFRAIERHEAFRQEVSDECAWILANSATRTIREHLSRFIIPAPKPDPLVEVMEKLGWYHASVDADDLRAALEARGLEIRSKIDD